MKQKEVEKPNVPFYFMRLVTFLENVKVSPDQQKELRLAKHALKQILLAFFGVGSCPGPKTLVPPGF